MVAEGWGWWSNKQKHIQDGGTDSLCADPPLLGLTKTAQQAGLEGRTLFVALLCSLPARGAQRQSRKESKTRKTNPAGSIAKQVRCERTTITYTGWAKMEERQTNASLTLLLEGQLQ